MSPEVFSFLFFLEKQRNISDRIKVTLRSPETIEIINFKEMVKLLFLDFLYVHLGS